MKTKNKALLLTLCAVLLVAATAFGTFAYLMDSEGVTNTFTVGQVGLTLDEADVDTNGAVVSDNRVTENEYHLIPGHTYTKDPTVNVDANSEDAWIFVKVENGIAAIEGGTTIAVQMAEKGWTLVDGTTNIYAYKEIVSKGMDVVVFEEFTIAGDSVDNDTLAGYADAEIKVTAYAVQAAGFENSLAAWNTTFGA